MFKVSIYNNTHNNSVDVDECLKDPQVCHQNAKCGYSNGSYVCQCTQGYIGDGKNCTGMDGNFKLLSLLNICLNYCICVDTLYITSSV